ncbi:KpsF/GutQ family sugar-phosphate isomerase [Candidatus Pelagibacter bacterium nBUS_32]|uniref:KpsF/GutQ family sugar-phosphate isomerase n=1 Tax=Candidatus Pelagibacter bacterium nBUS_32 TaxID=3374192 RepID=UPI003EBC0242
MSKKKFISIAKEVITLEIQALQKLKKNINNQFNEAVIQIAKCQSKVILCGVGKSGLIASKIAATLSSVGTPAFSLSASDSSHGDLGSISKKDILILISYSGQTEELKNIISYANRNKILLIGIVSKKDSILYKASNIKLLIPQTKEAGGIIPTASTTSQLALGDALAISSMQYKRFTKLDFKKIHPSGSLGIQLKTVEDIMLTGKKIPFINEKLKMKKALNILSNKKLGFLIIKNKQNKTIGIITDGEVRRYNEKKINMHLKNASDIMTKNPVSVDKNILAVKALSIMNNKKITSLLVHEKKNKYKTIGVIHIHNILQSNIS